MSTYTFFGIAISICLFVAIVYYFIMLTKDLINDQFKQKFTFIMSLIIAVSLIIIIFGIGKK